MRFVLASALLVGSGFAAPASAVECPSGLGIYRATFQTSHELLFTSRDGGTLVLSKGKVKATYPFSLSSSNGFSREYIKVSGKDAPGSLIMTFDSDFKPFQGQGSAPFLVTPDLARDFYYWDVFRSKYGDDILPGDAWRLVGCASGNMMGPSRKP